ncbi:hypothetical protein TKK_0012252 [Trichogramma kaykai]
MQQEFRKLKLGQMFKTVLYEDVMLLDTKRLSYKKTTKFNVRVRHLGIQNHDRRRTLIGYLMTDKLAHDSNTILRPQFSDHIEEVKTWLGKFPHCIDARIEVVEVFKNSRKLSLGKPSNLVRK